ncbi:hypothetical protein Y032_0038g3644 [Ancylostoma ceylanicum]|uniref:Uncharacterized protein n=1 Tax=Ancylostoma ceylanicum TaxID=53326 RepID=A0A016UIE0_9BILA|nr:hypothetical protein Y032_0038g3644 [Ancylostoma ceylanicum]
MIRAILTRESFAITRFWIELSNPNLSILNINFLGFHGFYAASLLSATGRKEKLVQNGHIIAYYFHHNANATLPLLLKREDKINCSKSPKTGSNHISSI